MANARPADAAAAYAEAIAIAESAPETITSADLGFIHWWRGDALAQAGAAPEALQDAFRAAYDQFRDAFGPDDPMTRSAAQDLAKQLLDGDGAEELSRLRAIYGGGLGGPEFTP